MARRPRSGDRRTLPILTLLACLVCVGLYLYNSKWLRGSAGPLEIVGYLPAKAIWDGAYWALITTPFVHLAWWHLILNLCWLWILGSAFELEYGALPWIAFVAVAAFVSSGAELLFGDTGIGMSGVIYAFFGLEWVARSHRERFQAILSEQTVRMLIVWLIACIPATLAGLLNVANGAHVGGLLFGLAAGAVFARRWKLYLSVPALILVVGLAALPLFWCPWLPEWTARRERRAWALRAATFQRRSGQRSGRWSPPSPFLP